MAYIGEMQYLTIGNNTYSLPTGGGGGGGIDVEVDPVFSASPAAGITAADITNWNGKGSGTVTSVGVANATNGGLSISGSPIISSGSITVGHSNVLSSAQTTQAVYPIKIDKNGHISAYGSAVTIPTKTSDLTNDSGFITSSSLNNYLEKSYTNPDATYAGGGTVSWSHENDTSTFSIYSYGNWSLDEVGGSASIEVMGHPEGSNITLHTGGEEINSYLRLDGFQFYIGMNNTSYIYSTYDGIKVTNLLAPTNNTDAATKKYVDDSIGALTIPTETTVSGWGFTKNTGTLTGVTFAGTSMSVSSGVASITQANARTALGLATVATSGSYNDLTNKPTIPTNTDEKLAVSEAYINASYSVLLGNGESSQTRQLDGGLWYQRTSGTVATANLYIGRSGHSSGNLILEDGISHYTTINTDTQTANRIITLPDKTGTVALTSDIPDVSGYSTTDEKLKTVALTSGTTYYPILATGANAAANRQVDSTLAGLKYVSTAGTTSTIGTAILQLGNSTASGTANNENGILRIYGTKSKYHDLRAVDGYPTWDRTVYFPRYANDMYLTCTSNMSATGGATTAPVYVDDTGCINAVTSIPYSLLTGTPTIPTISLNNNSTTSPAFYAPVTAGTSGQYLKSNGSGAPSWSSISDSDENVKSTLVTTGGTYYIVGSSNSSTNTSTLNKHDSVSFFVTTNTSVGDARLILGNSTASGTNSKRGLVRLYGSNAYYTDIISGVPSENNTITLPNATGTVALISDIPVSDVTVGGTSVVTNGVATIASPVQIVRW